MSDLAPLLQRFQAQILAPDEHASAPPDIEGHFDIYRNAYRGRLRQALADNYPVLLRAMGDEAFADLAQAYTTTHPSQRRSIRWFGHRLVEFIEAHPDVIPHPALRDIAQLDWAMRGAFDAADAIALSEQDLAQRPASDWPSLLLQLVPSARILQLQWAVQSLWHILNDDPDAQTEAPEPQEQSLLVWRTGLDCRWRTLAPAEAMALQRVKSGCGFAELCEHLQASGHADAATTAVNWLRQWISDGTLRQLPVSE